MRGNAERDHQILSGIRWRFLSEAITNPSPASVQPPWTNEARSRITALEAALASTHELEAQYQSFTQEASMGDDAVAFDWENTRALLASGAAHSVVTSEQADANDIIPSDPDPPAVPKPTGRGPKRAPKSAEALPRVGSASQEEADGSRPAAADGDGTEEPTHRSPSPVIIWRHAAPVKIASNLPPGLLPASATVAQTNVGKRAEAPECSAPQLRLGSASASSPAVAVKIDEKRAAQAKRMQYGAWYLPTDSWESRAQGGIGVPKGGRGANGASGSAAVAGVGGDAEGEEDADGNRLDAIPKLYSSKMYKEYLKSQKHARMPHYLTRVEDSPKQVDAAHNKRPFTPAHIRSRLSSPCRSRHRLASTAHTFAYSSAAVL